MKKIAFGLFVSIISSMAYADRFVDYDPDGTSAPLWLLVYIPIALVALVHEESPLHDWANSQPLIALGTFFMLPIVFLFKKLLAVIVLVVIFLFLLRLFRKSDSSDDHSYEKKYRSDQVQSLTVDPMQTETSHRPPQKVVGSSAENSFDRFISHATKMGAINCEKKEKMAEEFISYLTSEIDWSSVNHYRKTGGLDPDLGKFVLLVCTGILFFPLIVDEDSPKLFQFSEEKMLVWGDQSILKISKICSKEMLSMSFIDLDFSSLDDECRDLDDDQFSRDVELAVRHILKRYQDTISVLQQLGNPPVLADA